MYFYTEEGGTPTPYMGDAHWRHLASTISHLNYLLRRRCGLMSTYFEVNGTFIGDLRRIYENIVFLLRY